MLSFFLCTSLGEIGKHDRLKICSFTVIGSSPIVSNDAVRQKKGYLNSLKDNRGE